MTGMVSRRKLGGMLAVAASGLITIAPMAALAQEATPVSGSESAMDGVAGGGVLRKTDGDVTFSIMAFSVAVPGEEPVVGGFLRLVDETTLNHPLLLEATEIVSVGPLSAQSTTGRQVTGWGTLNMHGRYPFLLQVEDLGDPGSGEDTFNLVFGAEAEPFLSGEDTSGCDCGGLGYSLRSKVVAGDLSVIGER